MYQEKLTQKTKISHSHINPKTKILYPLIRFLKIDPREIFYPEMQRKVLRFQELQFLIEDYSEQESATLIPVVKAVLTAICSDWSNKIL